METNNSENSEVENKNYVIHIDNYDGPLDILWALIKKSKIDITEISISEITEQYIQFIKNMEELNVKIATEFIWMASELLYYKSRTLLPTGNIDDEYFVPPLPPELINKLLEFKKYQNASKKLNDHYEYQDNSFTRKNNLEEFLGKEEYIDASLFDLLKAFAEVLESEVTVEKEEIVFDEILVSDRIEVIAELLKENEVIMFVDIFSEIPSRPVIVASFLAILEMAKTKMIKIVQHKTFGDLRIARNFSMQNIKK